MLEHGRAEFEASIVLPQTLGSEAIVYRNRHDV